MEPQQQSFDTFGRWMLTRLRADLALNDEWNESPLHRFFDGLYADMLANPGAYSIPAETFTPFISHLALTPEESALHEALKAARMRVRKVVFAYLEFLFSLGQSGTPAGADLILAQAEFEKLAAVHAKKAKSKQFLEALERSGLIFSTDDPLVVSNNICPGMPAALAAFSQACARVKDFSFYLFRRCDLSVFDGKSAPIFTDALKLAPQPFQDAIIETDEYLKQLRFKREIFVDGGDMTYRLRYSQESVVYWCRIQETFQTDLRHYLRWKLDSDLTPRLFKHLDETEPGLSDQVFSGLQPCAHCYGENCLALARVEWHGVVKEACNEYGWDSIGYTQADHQRLRGVLGAIHEVVSRKER